MYDTNPNGRVLHGQTTDVSQGFSPFSNEGETAPLPRYMGDAVTRQHTTSRLAADRNLP